MILKYLEHMEYMDNELIKSTERLVSSLSIDECRDKIHRIFPRGCIGVAIYGYANTKTLDCGFNKCNMEITLYKLDITMCFKLELVRVGNSTNIYINTKVGVHTILALIIAPILLSIVFILVVPISSLIPLGMILLSIINFFYRTNIDKIRIIDLVRKATLS